MVELIGISVSGMGGHEAGLASPAGACAAAGLAGVLGPATLWAKSAAAAKTGITATQSIHENRIKERRAMNMDSSPNKDLKQQKYTPWGVRERRKCANLSVG
jgi:hypothetical protein